MRFSAAFAIGIAAASSALAQTPASDAAQQAIPTIISQSTLVLVPALVRDKKTRQVVYTLKADDFVLTDNGVPQNLHLEEDTGGEPLALVVDVDGGGAGAREIAKYTALAPMIESVIGDVPHKVAIVGYDSSPVLVQDFTPDVDAAAKAIQSLIDDDNGDSGAATLDSLAFSIDLLRKQPLQYRRAILLISESNDHGSHVTLEQALRAISDTNTAVYSIGFSSGTSNFKNESIKALGSPDPGPAHGCMSRDANDPNVDLKQNPGAQAYDCLSLLAPPLRLAKAAAIAIIDGLRKNIPETVARVTGGEYYKLTNAKSLEHDLATITNHIPNRYILSFQPQSPQPGFHSIILTAPAYAGLEISARNGYWADTTASPSR